MPCCPRNTLKKDRGFTLVEVMVAITILMLVILPLASLYVRSLTVIQNAALYSEAIQLAQERLEICETLDYGSLYYYNEMFTPGFPYAESPLPEAQRYDRDGVEMSDVVGNAYDDRNNPDTTDVVEMYFDPTDMWDEHYPVPVYRDYYNNYTGDLLDPNFNGLCDDDLDGDGNPGINGDGGWDWDDIEIATNGRGVLYSDPMYNNTKAQDEFGPRGYPVPGDGLWDTVVEGMYVSSMDPMYRWVRKEESPSAILDLGLLLDREHEDWVTDYRHREETYKNFVRMTTFIDPTPSLANPNIVETWVDSLYLYDRMVNDSPPYTLAQMYKLLLCLERDLVLDGGVGNYDVGVLSQDLVSGSDPRVPDQFTVSYSQVLYGMRIIVNVFYLTGEGEMELVDLNGDGFLEEAPMEQYGGARRVRLERVFYNNGLISGDGKAMPEPRWFGLSGVAGPNPAGSLTMPVVTGGVGESDYCDYENYGLPYLDPDYLSGQWVWNAT
jgi:prepilin-type N-terminal cleavage/methylation domain-containing protein